MAQVLVRDLPEETVARLKAKVAEAGRSLEAEPREILSQAAQPSHEQRKRVRWPCWIASAPIPALGGPASPRPPT